MDYSTAILTSKGIHLVYFCKQMAQVHWHPKKQSAMSNSWDMNITASDLAFHYCLRRQTMNMHRSGRGGARKFRPSLSPSVFFSCPYSIIPWSIDYRNPPTYRTLMNPKYPDLFFACSHLATFSSSIKSRSVCTWIKDCFFQKKLE